MLAGTVSLTRTGSIQTQQMVRVQLHRPWLTPLQANGARLGELQDTMRVQDSTTATATVRLDNVRTIATLPTTNPANNAVIGLLNVPACRDYVGSASSQLSTRLVDAPGSSLRVDCPTANVLAATNNNGQCLVLVYPKVASKIEVYGNRSIVIHADPANPPIVDVSGMTSWGAQAGPPNTRVIVYLSQLQSDALRASRVTIRGRLPYPIPQGQSGVIVYGCGASNVSCLATGRLGFPTCRLIEACVAGPAAAKTAALRAINSATPCVPPS